MFTRVPGTLDSEPLSAGKVQETTTGVCFNQRHVCIMMTSNKQNININDSVDNQQ